MIIIPFVGDTVSIIDGHGNIIKSYVFPIKKEFLMETAFFKIQDTVLETYFDIEDYISYISNTTKDKSSNEY